MKYLIPVAVGALIGYITNWLAIKMLFRPHYEKRIFGIRIPFTPGLIPKEKERIAKSVGEAVGTHLFSTDDFVDALCSKEVKKQVVEWLKNKISSYKNTKKSIYETLEFLGDTRDKIIIKIKKNLSILFAQMIKSKEKNIVDFINENFDIRLVLKNITENIDIKTNIYEIIAKAEVSDKKIKDIIPNSVDGSIKIYIYSNKDRIAEAVKETLSKDTVKEKISSSASRMVESMLGKFAAMFLSPELIGDKIISALDGYLSDENNHHDIAMVAIALYEKITETNVSDIAISFSGETKQEAINTVSNKIKEYINGLVDGLNIETIVQGLIENNDKIDEAIFVATDYMVDGIMNMDISKLIEIVDENEQDSILEFLDEIFEGFIKDKASKIIDLIDISRLVEDRINSFDVAFAEEIILDVASKELSAITWLGALLGAIMGIISPLLQML
ncbi:MAG: DUF445 family protein [Clostridiales bacterium]|nr:DUF445 family protein [Clostridiales bacterium]